MVRLVAAVLLAVLVSPATAHAAGPLDESISKALDPVRSQADAAQFSQIAGAVDASPALQDQIRKELSAGHLKDFRLKQPTGGPLPRGPFEAFISDGSIYLTPSFLVEQQKNRLFDVAIPNEVLPNTLVFSLGHLIHHFSQPSPNPAQFPAGMQAFLNAMAHDEAEAYIQGWNDMIDAATQANGGKPLTVTQVGHLLMNFRYRAPFFGALRQIDSNKLVIQNSGQIEPNRQNVDALASALGNSPIADVQ